MKQLDIFGNEIDVEKIQRETKKQRCFRLTIKHAFRKMYGYDESNHCADCINCICRTHNNRNYYKCRIMSMSNSEATDIRLKDQACSMFEKRGTK